jgi:hypothetical protein
MSENACGAAVLARKFHYVSCNFQNRNSVCEQKRKLSAEPDQANQRQKWLNVDFSLCTGFGSGMPGHRSGPTYRLPSF